MTPDWLKTYRGESRYTPQSAGQGLVWAQTKLAPLQAAVAALTGKWAGDLESLVDSSRTTKIVFCESCSAPLDWLGGGHTKSCELVAMANEVIGGRSEIERLRLEAESARLREKLARAQQKLERCKQ